MRRVLLALLAVFCAACGPATPQVRVVLSGDETLPCLGAKHLKVLVVLPEGNYAFDEFAQPIFFDLESFGCVFNQEWNYDRLALAGSVRIDVSLQDSTTGPAEEHILSRGSTVNFAVSEQSPSSEYQIHLTRRPEVSLGTAYLDAPVDWDTIKQGIRFMYYSVYQEGQMPVREHQLAYDSKTYPEPWPIIISNLPAGQTGELYKVRIDGMDGERKPLRSWYGDIFLQAYTIAWVNWAS